MGDFQKKKVHGLFFIEFVKAIQYPKVHVLIFDI